MKQKTNVEAEGYCVCCPRCSKMNRRCLTASTRIVCERCRYQYVAIVRGKTVFITDAKRAEFSSFRSRIREYEDWVIRLNRDAGEQESASV